MFKILFWLGLVGSAVLVAAQSIPVYYNNVKVENTFQGIVQNLVQQSEADIRNKIQKLMMIQSVNLEGLPDAFFENLIIKKENGKLTLSSQYDVTVWVLGEPEYMDADEIDEEGENISWVDRIKQLARIDFDFMPFAETP